MPAMRHRVLIISLLIIMFPFSPLYPLDIRESQSIKSDSLLQGINPNPPLQDSLNVRRVGRGLFEPLEAFTIDHDTCYVISGKDIVLYDVTDESAPLLLSSHRITITNIREVHSQGSYLYLTAYGNGFWILDKTDNFRAVGWYVPGGSVARAFIEDGKAYLVCEGNLHIVDVTQLGALQLLGIYDLNAALSMTYVTGDTCYITRSSYGLMVLDVSDPLDIIALDSLKITDGALYLTVRDTLAYLTGGHHITVVNVKDLTETFKVGRLDYEYLIRAPVQLHQEYVMLTTMYSGIRLLDVSNPENMYEVGSYPASDPAGAVFAFPYVFVTNEEGLRIIDFSPPQEPELVKFVEGDYTLEELDVHDSYAYICDFNHYYGGGVLRVLDVREPSVPRAISSLEINGANDVQIDYPLAYIGSRTTGFYILNISNHDSIVQIGHSDVDARGIYIQYPYAYLAIEHWDLDGLKVLDISHPDSIVELGYYPILSTDDVFVQDTIAYVASSFDGVYIINVKDPEQLTRISRFPTYDIASDVHVSGNYLYVAAGYAGISVVDISDPAMPIEVAYSLAGYGNKIHVVDPYLYLAGGSYGLRVLDISEPDSIHEVGYYGKASVGGIYADEDYIYMGTFDGGFYIFEFTPVGIIPVDEGGFAGLPKSFVLHQNYPNPFNPTTTISFDIPEEKEHVKLTVYDLRGRHVKTLIDSELIPGNHRVSWDGRNDRGEVASSGVYFYTIKTGDHVATRKMTVVR